MWREKAGPLPSRAILPQSVERAAVTAVSSCACACAARCRLCPCPLALASAFRKPCCGVFATLAEVQDTRNRGVSQLLPVYGCCCPPATMALPTLCVFGTVNLLAPTLPHRPTLPEASQPASMHRRLIKLVVTLAHEVGGASAVPSPGACAPVRACVRAELGSYGCVRRPMTLTRPAAAPGEHAVSGGTCARRLGRLPVAPGDVHAVGSPNNKGHGRNRPWRAR